MGTSQRRLRSDRFFAVASRHDLERDSRRYGSSAPQCPLTTPAELSIRVYFRLRALWGNLWGLWQRFGTNQCDSAGSQNACNR